MSYCDNGALSLAVCDVLPLFISVFRIFICISLSFCLFPGLCRCVASSAILSEEQELMVFGNRVVRKVFGLPRGRKWPVPYRGGGGEFNSPSPRNSEVLIKLSRISSSVENTSIRN
jgi:hypothetical protein